MKAELFEERRMRKAAERENRSLRERLGQANEERYGEKRQRVRKKNDSGEAEKPEPDRNDEKDDFDGTEGTLRTDSVDAACPQAASATSRQDRDLSNRSDTYKRTGVAGAPLYLAERVIRKLTIQRNNSLHYGSDEGARMAATYHSVISTVKLHGGSAWEYIGTFFKNIFNGCRDYVNMVPGRIAMATCQR